MGKLSVIGNAILVTVFGLLVALLAFVSFASEGWQASRSILVVQPITDALAFMQPDGGDAGLGKPGPASPETMSEAVTLLLLIPFGAFIISLMRNVIGMVTLGLFAPILYALAFLSAGLLLGVLSFLIVLALGYGLRNVLDPLRVHPLPRLSIILSAIVAVFVVLINLGEAQGAATAQAFGAFPIVIWASSIERVFNLSEEFEGGPVDVLKLIGGTLAVTITIYLAFKSPQLRELVTEYPISIMIPIVGQFLIGRYRGIRVTELIRFKQIWKNT